MADTDYPKTITKLLDWSQGVHERVHQIEREYTTIKYALDTGEGDPNNIMLTPAQLAILASDIVVLNEEIEEKCSAYDVELEEIPDPD